MINKNKVLVPFFKVCILLITILNYSCEEKFFNLDVDCDECYSDKPDSADLIIELSDTYFDSLGIQMIVYEGNIENNNVIFIDTVKTKIFYLYVPVNKFYSVSANYWTKDNKRYVVTNGTELQVKRVSEECSETCWVITKQNINLKVKYDKYFE